MVVVVMKREGGVVGGGGGVGGGGFHNTFGDEPIGVTHRPPKEKPLIFLKIFVLWDAPQPIKLTNMNHNKYPSSCKSLGQK